jgi:hypothetical protein
MTYNIADPYLGTTDTLVIEIPIDLKGRELPLELLICQRKDLKNYLSTYAYLENMVKNSNAKHFKPKDKDLKSKSSLMIMSEHDEIVSQLINE